MHNTKRQPKNKLQAKSSQPTQEFTTKVDYEKLYKSLLPKYIYLLDKSIVELEKKVKADSKKISQICRDPLLNTNFSMIINKDGELNLIPKTY